MNTYRYDPWGTLIDSDETVENPYRYASYRADASTGLYYCWNRYYAPELGRFLTRDIYPGETSDPVTMNPYLYCGGDPVNYVDPSGMATWGISIILPSFTFGAGGIGRSVTPFMFVWDDKGNIAMASSQGPATVFPYGASATRQYQHTSAESVYDLAGVCEIVGGSGGGQVGPVPMSAGIERMRCSQYEGWNDELGIGIGSPVEVHAGESDTAIWGRSILKERLCDRLASLPGRAHRYKTHGVRFDRRNYGCCILVGSHDGCGWLSRSGVQKKSCRGDSTVPSLSRASANRRDVHDCCRVARGQHVLGRYRPDTHQCPVWLSRSDLLERTTDPLGHEWSFAHDAAGNTTESVYPTGDTVSGTFTPDDLVAATAFSTGETYGFAYSPTHRLTGVTDAGDRTWTYAYNPVGRLTRHG